MFEGIRDKSIDIVWACPETIYLMMKEYPVDVTDDFASLFGVLIVDEVQDNVLVERSFRKEFSAMCKFQFTGIRVALMTGTLTDVVADGLKVLFAHCPAAIEAFDENRIISVSHDRSNLYYSIVQTSSKKNLTCLIWIIDLMNLWVELNLPIMKFPAMMLFFSDLGSLCYGYDWLYEKMPQRFRQQHVLDKYHANVTDEETRKRKLKDFVLNSDEGGGSIGIMTSTTRSKIEKVHLRAKRLGWRSGRWRVTIVRCIPQI